MSSASRPSDLEHLLAHADWLARLARALTRDAAEAQDVVQDTWLAALRRPPHVHEGGGADARAWLARVARRLASRRRRAATRRGDHESRVELPRDVDDAASAAERVAWQRELADRVLALPEMYRTPIALRYFEGVETAEIARRLSMTPQAVRQRLSRGLARLREELDRSRGSRESWLGALASFAGVESGLEGVGIAPAIQGVLAVKTVQRVALVVLLLVLAWFGWRALERTPNVTQPLVASATDALSSPPSEARAEPVVSTRESLSTTETVAPAAVEPTGELVFLVHPRGPAPEGSRWRLESRSGRAIELDVPASGRVNAPIGSWTLRAIGAAWSASVDALEIQADGSQVVWVGGEQTLDVLVVDSRGAPIERATVEWIRNGAWPNADLADESSTVPQPEHSAITDAAGRARLSWRGIVDGTLRVREGARSPERIAVGAPQSEPLRVALGDRDLETSELRVVDAADGAPLVGVELVNEATREVVTTDVDGRARVRTRSPAEASFIVRGGGVFPMQLDPDGVTEVRAARATELVVRSGTSASDGERAQLSVRIEGTKPEVSGGPLPAVVSSTVELPFERRVAVPVGARVFVALVTERARGAFVEHHVCGANETLTLAPETSNVLRIGIRGPQRALAGLRVEPRYGGLAAVERLHAIEAAPASTATGGRRVVELPCAEFLARVRIRGPGCLPIELERRQGELGPAAGALEVELVAAEHAFDVTCVDEEGRPLAGVRIVAHDEIDLEFVRRFRELHGARPTSHAAWAERRRNPSAACTAADGRARLWLPASASVQLSAQSTPADSAASDLLSFETRRVETPRERELRWVLPRARRVTLHAFDAHDGTPVDRFEVVDPDAYNGPTGEGQGGVWQGWVPVRTTRLAVSAAQERSGEVALPRRDPDQDVTLRVELGAAPTGVLAFEGPATNELRGTLLRFLVEKAGKPAELEGFVDWQTEVLIHDTTGVRVAVPIPEALVTIMESTNEPYRFRFTPQRFLWRMGETNIVRVERR